MQYKKLLIAGEIAYGNITYAQFSQTSVESKRRDAAIASDTYRF